MFVTSLRNCKSFKSKFHHARHLYMSPPYILWNYEPVALRTYREGKMKEKVESALKELENCVACPRNCKVNRLNDQKGACNTGRHAIVSSAFPHFGEESVLQGWNGSGTIFFGLCNMRCVFCQNWDISQKNNGWKLTAEEIADLMLKLQNETKCHNINFVTPEHNVPQVIEAIAIAVENGLNLPIVYNTSSYDSVNSLKLLDGLIDIYMPDFKFWLSATSEKLAKARNYPLVAKDAIKEMYRQVGDLCFNEDGLARKGLIIRHLVMPGLIDEGKSIMEWIGGDISKDTYVNIMEQYRPTFLVGKGEKRVRHGFTKYEEIDRFIDLSEKEAIKDHAKSVGLWRFEDDSLPAFWTASFQNKE